MKKFIVPIIALVLAVGASAFKAVGPSRTLTTYYWYKTNTGTGSQSSFNDADVQFIQSSTSAPTLVCSGTQTHKCVVGFTANQLADTQTAELMDNQAPAQLGERKPLP